MKRIYDKHIINNMPADVTSKRARDLFVCFPGKGDRDRLVVNCRVARSFQNYSSGKNNQTSDLQKTTIYY